MTGAVNGAGLGEGTGCVVNLQKRKVLGGKLKTLALTKLVVPLASGTPGWR